MATLTINGVELQIQGGLSWALNQPAAFGHITAWVDISSTTIDQLNGAGANVRLQTGDKVIGGLDMFQVGSMVTNGSSVRVDFRSTDVREIV